MKIRYLRPFVPALLTLSCSHAFATPPAGWSIAGNAPTRFEFGTDAARAEEGQRSATIRAKDPQDNDFGTLMQTIAADDFRGSRVRLSAALRTEDAVRAQMWMRVDGGDRHILAFDNMDSRPVTGTRDWARYEIVLDVPTDSIDIAFGTLLSGGGKVWIDDYKLEKVAATIPLTGPSPQRSRTLVNPGFEQR